MAFRVIRNQDGNCINFRGSSNPAYWNACLSAEVDTEDSDRINVINDVKSAGGPPVYEFYKIPFTEFEDADGNVFASAIECADYITTQARVLDVTGASYRGVWNAETNSPALADTDTPNTGDFYFVSTAGASTLGGVSSWRKGDRVLWNGTVWQKLPATSVVDANTRSTLLNTQTSIFADGEPAAVDPSGTGGWYYRNTANGKINWYFYGDTDVTSYTLGDWGGSYAVVEIRAPGSEVFFSSYTRRMEDGDDVSWYRSRQTHAVGSMGSAAAGTYLVHTSNFDPTGIEPTLPRLSLALEPGTTAGPQADAEELYLLALSTSTGLDEGANEFVVRKFGIRLGDHIQAYDLLAPTASGPSVGASTPTTLDFLREVTNTTILTDNGDQFGVNSITAVLNANGTIDIQTVEGDVVKFDDLIHTNLTIAGAPAGTTAQGAVNALNALFAVQPLGDGGDYVPVYPTIDAEDVTLTQAEGIVPTTEKEPGVPHLYSVNTDTSGHGARVWSTETIDTAGEYFLVRIIGGGRFIIGLADASTDSNADGTADDLAELTSNSGSAHSGLFWGQAFYDYGSYQAPWTIYGSSPALSYGPGWNGSTSVAMRYNGTVQAALAAGSGLGALFKIGLDEQGYIACWYYDEGRSNEFIKTSRRAYTTPAGNYALAVKLWDQNATLVETPERVATDPTAPALTYRFIESPDGSFYHPLFATAEEAEWVDTQNGGSGMSHTHVWPDEPTNTTWHMPSTGGTHAGASRPADTAEITYTEIPTEADNLHAPAALNIPDQTVNEGASVNLQVVPQDVAVTMTGLPAGLSYSAGYITGTAPEVAGNNVDNPSDVSTVTVTRANAYGSTVETFSFTVTNLTAPSVPVTGFSLVSGSAALVDSDTMGDGSAVTIDETVTDGQRFIISKSWVEANVLPYVVSGSGTKEVFVGYAASGADFTDGATASDFDLAWVFGCDDSRRGSGNWTLRRVVSGAYTLNLGVGSQTSALYDYVLTNDGGTLEALAALPSAGVSTLPSAANGGTWAQVGTLTGQGTATRTVTIATAATQADLSTSGLSEAAEPAAPAGLTTPWNKALDFSGSAQRAKQVVSDVYRNPMRMAGWNSTVPGNANAGYTSSYSTARPWACACVFRVDGTASNQHIWNQGEGAGSNDDNIYLRVDANRRLYFGWGRSGALNELFISTLTTSDWYGVYVAHTGERLSGANATAANLADCFDIRLMSTEGGDPFGSLGPQRSISAGWGGSNSTTGGRMDRAFTGDFTVGGRGSNRSFHGKIASMVVTTLKLNVPLPTEAEAKAMITDPVQWLYDYKVGETFRQPSTGSNTAGFYQGTLVAARSTQVWLMGDGDGDAFAKIRNQVWSADQNGTPLDMISMVSNDIETVNIPGLT